MRKAKDADCCGFNHTNANDALLDQYLVAAHMQVSVRVAKKGVLRHSLLAWAAHTQTATGEPNC